jgi:hypothetical protein
MENPKLRIESDGKHTEIYIDGKQIERVTDIDFVFFHSIDENDGLPACSIRGYVTDKSNIPTLLEDNTLIKYEQKIF